MATEPRSTASKKIPARYHYYLVFKPRKAKPSTYFQVLGELSDKFESRIQGSGYSQYAKVLDVHLYCTAAECRQVLTYIKKYWGKPTIYRYQEDDFEAPYIAKSAPKIP